jgi:GntR family transcriptional regulator
LSTQLAWKLRAAIAGGTLRPGDRLPAVREMAAAAGVNVNTVRAVYARLASQGVIVSEHGRGTFVTGSGGSGPEMAELVERAAHEARSHAVDPRDLAAMLYARFDAPAGPGAADRDVEVSARRALRAEIEALEHDLAALGAPAGAAASGGNASVGARLVSVRELEVTRDALAERVVERRRELRAARRRAAAPPDSPSPARSTSAWPELAAAFGRPLPT